jgi:hypothetical protein
MSQYDPSKTMCDEKQRSFPELTIIQSVSWAKHRRATYPHLLCVPHFLDLLHEFPPIIQYHIGPTTGQLRMIAVHHRPTAGQILGEEVPQPHSTQVSFPSPRAICVAVQSGDGDDAIATSSQKIHFHFGRTYSAITAFLGSVAYS